MGVFDAARVGSLRAGAVHNAAFRDHPALTSATLGIGFRNRLQLCCCLSPACRDRNFAAYWKERPRAIPAALFFNAEEHSAFRPRCTMQRGIMAGEGRGA